jgi:hypothetical protein
MSGSKPTKTSAKIIKKIKPQVWNFISAPYLRPMRVTLNVKKPGRAPGFIFVAPYTAYGNEMMGQTGALIMDRQGNPVWFRPLKDRTVQNTDFRMQYYHRRPVLTMWEGTISGTKSANPNLPAGDPEPGAFFQILNQNYEVIKKIKAQKDFTADVHEFIITKKDTALFTAIKQVQADLRPFGGPEEGYFDDYSIQEVDIKTGKLLFIWDALTHVNPGNSILPASSAVNSNNIWDCYHMNSVEEGPNNTLLVSMRNMCAVYSIDKKTGKILWQLGGKKSDFTFGDNAQFYWQHDARYGSDGTISLLDDARCACPEGPTERAARSLVLRLDFKKMQANVDRTYYHDPLAFAPAQGNVQELQNGNQFVGWGQPYYASEFANEGNTQEDPSVNFLYDMQFPNRNISYRAFKYLWVGMPLDPPSAVAKRYPEATMVYASWNGSTETSAWQVLAGLTRDKLVVVVSSTPCTGFETKIKVEAKGPYFKINALDKLGQMIGTTEILHIF